MSPTSNITGGATEEIFRARVLGKYDVGFFRCSETGYIQTEKPYWLEEAYASPMNLCDTGVLVRNTYFSAILRRLLGTFFGPEQSFLDYAGGYGIMTRMMRDGGFDYSWCDPFTKNVMARGFEHVEGRTYGALSSIEVFEHLVQPREELAKMRRFSPNIVFSTLLVPDPWPKPEDWWYYGLSHGQHVSFYTVKSLEVLAQQQGLRLATNGRDLHAFLQPELLPLEIEARWLKHWLAGEGMAQTEAIRQAYTYVSCPVGRQRWNKRLKQILRGKKTPAVYLLKSGVAPGDLAGLRSSSLASDYAGYLLSDGKIDEARLATRFPSRTQADHDEMARRMIEQHGNHAL